MLIINRWIEDLGGEGGEKEDRGREKKCFLMDKGQLINIEGMMKLENNYLQPL